MSWRMSVLFFCFLFLLSWTSGLSAEVDQGLDRRWPILASEARVWVGTLGGLYRYDTAEDGWQRFTPGEGLCHWTPGILGLDQGILWVGTSAGLCNADVRLFDWDVFDTSRGMPGNQVNAFSFEEDYVWVGTDAGVVRYDPLREELEQFTGEGMPAGLAINDIAVEGETVWLATSEGIWEFSRKYETWKRHGHAEGLRSTRAQRIFSGAGFIWFFTGAGLERFEPNSRTWLTHEITDLGQINDVALEGSVIWLATDVGVFFYDTALDQWRQFQELNSLGIRNINGMTIAQDDLWLTTDQGVARFDRQTHVWTWFTVDNGLSSNETKTIAFWDQILFITSEVAIDYYKFDEERWYAQPVALPESAEGMESPKGIFSLGGPQGTVFCPAPSVRMRLLGRASYQYQRSDMCWSNRGWGHGERQTLGRTDLVLAAGLGDVRTAHLFYDDTKFQGDRECGGRYRGEKGDLLGELSLGDVRCSPGRGEMLPTLGLFGGAAVVEAGERTDRLRRRRLSLSMAGGDQTTGFQTDTFIGSARSYSGSVEDRQYLRRRFFPLTGEQDDLNFRAGSERIYVDDGLDATNTVNTKENWTVAGMEGDFDLISPVQDYALDGHTGTLDMLAPISPSAVLVATFKTQGGLEEAGEVVLYGQDVDRSLANRYSLGAKEILPHTLSVKIVDREGLPRPLDEFGLDRNGDGVLDGEWVNFYDGILWFPSAHPFSDSIYDPVAPGHEYTIEYSYQTSSAILQLSTGDLISESERVEVDGSPLRRGEDYIIDYRSGSLLFLSEGLVEQGSRILVEYEFRRASDDRLGSAGLSFSPSDEFTTAVTMVAFQPQDRDGDSRRESSRLWHASGELRIDDGPGGADFLAFSEAAHSQGERTGATAATIEISARKDDVRFLTRLEDYGQEFISPRPRQTPLGQLLHRILAEAQFERPNLLVFQGDWSRESSLLKSGSRAEEDQYQARLIMNRQNLPAVSVALSRRLESDASPFPDQTAIKIDMEYQIPQRWRSSLRLHTLKVSSYLHRTWEEGDISTSSSVSDKVRRHGDYLRLDIGPATDVHMVASLRRDQRRIKMVEIKSDYQPVEETGETVFTASCDRIPGLSFYLRLEGNAHEDLFTGIGQNRMYGLSRQRQTVARINPGRWQHLFRPLTVEFDYSYRWNGQLSGLGKGLGFQERYWSSFQRDGLLAGERFESKAVRLELIPSAVLILNVGLEHQNQDWRQLSSFMESHTWTLNNKVELRRDSSLYVFSYLRDESEKPGISIQVKSTPSLWWERRWSRTLLSKLSLFLEHDILRKQAEKTTFLSLSPRLSITSRWDHLEFFGDVELTDDISLTFSANQTWQAETAARVAANTFKLDLRPFPLALIRLQSQVSQTTREPGEDTIRHDLTMKLTIQF